MKAFYDYLIDYSLLTEDKKTDSINRYFKIHKDDATVQREPERARTLIGHALSLTGNADESKFITKQFLTGRYKMNEDEESAKSVLRHWRKGKASGAINAATELSSFSDHDAVFAHLRTIPGLLPQQAALDPSLAGQPHTKLKGLEDYHIGTIHSDEYGPLSVYNFRKKDMEAKGPEEMERVRKLHTATTPPTEIGCTWCTRSEREGPGHFDHYAHGPGFFSYHRADGKAVLSHGFGDRGVVDLGNTVIPTHKLIVKQTSNLLSGEMKEKYDFLNAGSDKHFSPEQEIGIYNELGTAHGLAHFLQPNKNVSTKLMIKMHSDLRQDAHKTERDQRQLRYAPSVALEMMAKHKDTPLPILHKIIESEDYSHTGENKEMFLSASKEAVKHSNIPNETMMEFINNAHKIISSKTESSPYISWPAIHNGFAMGNHDHTDKTPVWDWNESHKISLGLAATHNPNQTKESAIASAKLIHGVSKYIYDNWEMPDRDKKRDQLYQTSDKFYKTTKFGKEILDHSGFSPEESAYHAAHLVKHEDPNVLHSAQLAAHLVKHEEPNIAIAAFNHPALEHLRTNGLDHTDLSGLAARHGIRHQNDAVGLEVLKRHDLPRDVLHAAVTHPSNPTIWKGTRENIILAAMDHPQLSRDQLQLAVNTGTDSEKIASKAIHIVDNLDDPKHIKFTEQEDRFQNSLDPDYVDVSDEDFKHKILKSIGSSHKINSAKLVLNRPELSARDIQSIGQDNHDPEVKLAVLTHLMWNKASVRDHHNFYNELSNRSPGHNYDNMYRAFDDPKQRDAHNKNADGYQKLTLGLINHKFANIHSLYTIADNISHYTSAYLKSKNKNEETTNKILNYNKEIGMAILNHPSVKNGDASVTGSLYTTSHRGDVPSILRMLAHGHNHGIPNTPGSLSANVFGSEVALAAIQHPAMPYNALEDMSDMHPDPEVKEQAKRKVLQRDVRDLSESRSARTIKPFYEYLIEESLTLEYHDTLNPKIWDGDELKSEVQARLLQIAKKWAVFAKIPDSAITDIILVGGNANYNWTKFSDLDLHVVVNRKNLANCPDLLDDYLQNKKQLWALVHDITIYDHDVELYAQDRDTPYPKKQGVYSIKNKKWIVKPKHEDVDFRGPALLAKVKQYTERIDTLISTNAEDESFSKLKEKFKNMRSSGLKKIGEFSMENLVFKELRNRGVIDRMSKYLNSRQDEKLSLLEYTQLQIQDADGKVLQTISNERGKYFLHNQANNAVREMRRNGKLGPKDDIKVVDPDNPRWITPTT